MDLRLKKKVIRIGVVTIPIVFLFGLVIGLSKLSQNHHDPVNEGSNTQEVVDLANTKERTQKHTREQVRKFEIAVQSKNVEDMQTIALAYRANLSNAFFSPHDFFKDIPLSASFINELFTNLESLDGLDDVEFSKGHDGLIPKPIELRMAILDFMRDAAQEREFERPLLMAKMQALVESPFPSQASDKVKRILFSEKVDLILAMTMVDKEFALNTMLALKEPLQTKMRTGYYLGLESSTQTKEDYQYWVDRLIAK